MKLGNPVAWPPGRARLAFPCVKGMDGDNGLVEKYGGKLREVDPVTVEIEILLSQ